MNKGFDKRITMPHWATKSVNVRQQFRLSIRLLTQSELQDRTKVDETPSKPSDNQTLAKNLISTDTDNQLTTGADGLLYVNANNANNANNGDTTDQNNNTSHNYETADPLAFYILAKS